MYVSLSIYIYIYSDTSYYNDASSSNIKTLDM